MLEIVACVPIRLNDRFSCVGEEKTDSVRYLIMPPDRWSCATAFRIYGSKDIATTGTSSPVSKTLDLIYSIPYASLINGHLPGSCESATVVIASVILSRADHRMRATQNGLKDFDS